MTKLRNQASEFDTYVSMKKEVQDLHEIQFKFTNKKQNLNLIKTNKKPSFNKKIIGFKSDRSHSKSYNMKKFNRLIYKISYCDRISNLEPFCYENLRRYRGRNPRTLRTTNALRPKKIWVPIVKT